jgi:hypothetical protein
VRGVSAARHSVPSSVVDAQSADDEAEHRGAAAEPPEDEEVEEDDRTSLKEPNERTKHEQSAAIVSN